MFKIIVLAMLVAVASAGLAPVGYNLNYGYNIGGQGGHGGQGGYGGYGGYGIAAVNVQQNPHAYQYGVKSQAPGGNSYVQQSAAFGGYKGGYGAGGVGVGYGGAY